MEITACLDGGVTQRVAEQVRAANSDTSVFVAAAVDSATRTVTVYVVGSADLTRISTDGVDLSTGVTLRVRSALMSLAVEERLFAALKEARPALTALGCHLRGVAAAGIGGGIEVWFDPAARTPTHQDLRSVAKPGWQAEMFDERFVTFTAGGILI